MYAVIKTGGKQYRVAKDDVIVVERLAGAAGDKIELDQVLMLDDGNVLVVYDHGYGVLGEQSGVKQRIIPASWFLE